MNNHIDIAGKDWPSDRLIPAFQTPQHLNVYDIRSVSQDMQLSITTLAGLINRPQPQIYLINGNDDIFWLKELYTSIPHDTPTVANNAILDALLTTYRNSVQGMIIYDPDFIDSVNIATTLAGQRDGIVVSPAQAQALQKDQHKLPILADLRNYQWYTRLDAYYWAQQNLLNNASTRFIAGLDPKNPTGLRSFLVATRTFVYWLDSRKFLPDPTLQWLSERGLMQQLFSAFPPGATHLGWFIDESSGVVLTSQAAIPVLATDLFYNLETWTSIPATTPGTKVVLADRLSEARTKFVGGLDKEVARTPETPAQQATTPSSKVYVSFTISDGDNLQYSQHRMLRLWRDPARGSVPIGWTISPVLAQAAPSMAAYYTHTATTNDELIAGPSGAGYIFPSHWPIDQLPAFLQRTGQLMQSMNLTLLEVLDTDLWPSTGLTFLSCLGRAGMTFTEENLQQQFVQALCSFGMCGLLSGAGLNSASCITWNLKDVNVPVYQNLGLAGSVSDTVRLIEQATAMQDGSPLFLNVYILAWTMTPSDLKQVVQQLGDGYEVLTPGKLLAMVAKV